MPVGIPNVLEFENDLKPFRYNDMGTFLVYIIKSAFCLTLLYLPYTLLLRGEKHHRLSRMALHVLSVAAFLLPLVQEEWFGGAVRSWQTAMPEGTYAVLVERLEQADVLAMPDTGSSEEAVLIWPMVLVGLYLAGVAVSLAVRLWQWVRMHRFVSRGCLWKEGREGGITLYCHARPVSPFSWMHCIVMSEEDLDGEAGHAIYVHEKAHVLYGHSYDTLWMLAVEAVQWFNPVVWMMEMDMRCIHEYQADAYVLGQGINAKDYQLYLIRKAVGARLQSFANGLNQSTLKKRIAMMCNKKSTKWAVLKYMYLLPVGAFATVAFARPEVVNGVDGRLEQLSAVKVTDLSATAKAVAAENVQPEPLKMEKAASKAEVSEVKAAKPSSVVAKADSAVAASERTSEGIVVKAMAPRNGLPDRVEFKEAELARTEGKDSASYYLRLKSAKVVPRNVYDVVDVKPMFPGGDSECMAYVAHNMKYPSECLKNGVTGRVFCSFVIDSDGSLCRIEAGEKSYAKAADGSPAPKGMLRLFVDEAFRVISGMPKWTPGQKDGKAVPVRYVLPFTFRLQ